MLLNSIPAKKVCHTSFTYPNSYFSLFRWTWITSLVIREDRNLPITSSTTVSLNQEIFSKDIMMATEYQNMCQGFGAEITSGEYSKN